jgi:hypothetical protein
MKKTLLFLTALMICLFNQVQAESSISFQSKQHDFGELSEEDGSASCDFIFTNKGNSALVIHKAVASCGCTTPVYSKEPIAPGATSTVKVTYNTDGRPGAFHKTITLYTNDPNAPNVVLIIKGNVSPKSENPETAYPKNLQGLRLRRTVVPILDAKIGSIRTETIEMINTNATPVSIKFSKVPRHIRVSASNSVLKYKQTGTITIKYLAAEAKDYGKRDDSFYVYTNDRYKNNPNNRINLTANITEDFSNLSSNQMNLAPACTFSENRINFGKMERGTHRTLTITLTNSGKSTLQIRKIIPEYDGIRVTPEKMSIPAGKTIKFHINFNAGTFDGNVVQRITVITNAPQASVNRLFIIAQVTGK